MSDEKIRRGRNFETNHRLAREKTAERGKLVSALGDAIPVNIDILTQRARNVLIGWRKKA